MQQIYGSKYFTVHRMEIGLLDCQLMDNPAFSLIMIKW